MRPEADRGSPSGASPRRSIDVAVRIDDLDEISFIWQEFGRFGYRDPENGEASAEPERILRSTPRHELKESEPLRIIVVSRSEWSRDPFGGDWKETYDASKGWCRPHAAPIILRLAPVELPVFLFDAVAFMNVTLERANVIDAFRNRSATGRRLLEALELEPRDEAIDLALAILVQSEWSANLQSKHSKEGHVVTEKALREVEPALDPLLARFLAAISARNEAAVRQLLNGPHREALLKATLKNGDTPLHISALVRDGARVVQTLLDHKADPNVANIYGVMPLTNAAWNGNDMVAALVRSNADVRNVGLQGENALAAAAWNGLAEAVDLLLEAGGDPFVTDFWGGHALAWAVRAGHHDIIRAILKRHRGMVDCLTGERGWGSRELSGADPDLPAISRYARSSEKSTQWSAWLGYSALHYACTDGALESARTLLDHGADPNRTNRDGTPPLAGAFSAEQNVEAIVDLLLERGAQAGARCQSVPLVVLAVDSKHPRAIIEKLLQWGADIHAVGSDGLGALHRAVWTDDEELVVWLAGLTNIERADSRGFRPLHIAIEHGSARMVRRLLALGADPSGRDPPAPVPSLQAILTRDDDKIDALLEHEGVVLVDEKGTSALHLAAGTGNLRLIATLLERGADANARDRHGDTPLHDAVWGNSWIAVAPLVRGGARADERNEKGRTPLHLAVEREHWKTASALLGEQANASIPDNEGRSAAVTAALLRKTDFVSEFLAGLDLGEASPRALRIALIVASAVGDDDRVGALLAAGVPVDGESDDGWRALSMAAKHGHRHMVDALLGAGAQVNWRLRIPSALTCGVLSGDAALVATLLEAGADVDATGPRGFTALHAAGDRDAADLVALLVNRGACLHARSEDGATALHLAAALDRVESGRALLDLGASASSLNARAETPLHVAARQGHARFVRLLVDRMPPGERRNLRQQDGQTALHLAAHEGHLECVRVLLEAGLWANDSDRSGFTPADLAQRAGHVGVVGALVQEGGARSPRTRPPDTRPSFLPWAPMATTRREMFVRDCAWGAQELRGDGTMPKLSEAKLAFYDDGVLVAWPASKGAQDNFALWSAAHHRVVRLDFTSRGIYQANDSFGWNIDEQSAISYVKFFCFFVRSELGRFRIVEGDEDIPWAPAARPPDRNRVASRVEPLRVLSSNILDTLRLCGTMLYNTTLYFTEMYVSLKAQSLRFAEDKAPERFSIGQIHLTDEKLLEDDLAVEVERPKELASKNT